MYIYVYIYIYIYIYIYGPRVAWSACLTAFRERISAPKRGRHSTIFVSSTRCTCAVAASWFDSPHRKVVPRSRIPRSTSHFSCAWPSGGLAVGFAMEIFPWQWSGRMAAGMPGGPGGQALCAVGTASFWSEVGGAPRNGGSLNVAWSGRSDFQRCRNPHSLGPPYFCQSLRQRPPGAAGPRGSEAEKAARSYRDESAAERSHQWSPCARKRRRLSVHVSILSKNIWT